MTNFEPEPGPRSELRATSKTTSYLAELGPTETAVAAESEQAATESQEKHISRFRLIARRFWRPLGAKVGVVMLSVKVEKSILWIIDLMLVIPSFLLIAIISQNTGGNQGSTWLFILLLVAFSWMLSSRVVRAMTLSVVSLDYVNAARFMNVPSWVTITKHVIPNISSFLIIDWTLAVAGAIMSETALSFFGFGVQAPETSLGTLLAEGTQMATTFPWVFLAPASLLVLTLLSVNFIGDSLRDAIDPSSKSGGQA